ncbi:hypothetical protein I5520_01695 [Citrobacter sp. FDAARGOS_156]|uniref:hypothetical protein n=1 Tax=Citrobacter sp. FDAARGOS_156 TaxID=1702170 RepID=UPI0019056234|nr:hypothetical protein [Citrobacter sp. FDAARGOS_156]MBJ9640710.1 hypothetical protein [Citrobacter sp. FDAARGOS_156]
MLEGYFNNTAKNSEDAIAKSQRLLAVQAAMEIVKASVSATTSYTGRDKLGKELDFAKDKVSELADAIQKALDK